MKVLIAEDEAISRRLLQGYLERWGHEVVAAQNGAEAWALFTAGEFSIVISDWVMPELDGVELIRRIRAHRRPGYVYAILVTSKSQKEDIVEGMEAGADDFVTKPFDRDELRVRLRAGQRIIELESALLASLEELAQARHREVEVGAKIQQTLLLGQPPHDLPGVRVAALTSPSQQIDGDFYDFYRHNDRCLDVVVGDVMGKGVPAALLGAAIKSYFLRAFSQLSAALDRGKLPEPEEIITVVHADVTRQFIGLESFATLCYARFDVEKRRVTFVDCGHTKTVHFRQRTGTGETLQGKNIPLGFSEREIYKQVSVPFEGGDVFFFYSDGVTEAQNDAGEFFGGDRLVELIKLNNRLAPEELIDRVRRAVSAFSHAETFADDVTCVAIKVEDSGEALPLAHTKLEVTSDLAELASIRAFVRGFCRGLVSPALDEENRCQLELAVNEAASNVMRHAYHGRADQRIQLEAAAFADRISLRLYHRGDAFDPETVRPPMFDGSREGGFGLYIIAQSVDEVRYGRDEQGRNCIYLGKNRKTTCREAIPRRQIMATQQGRVRVYQHDQTITFQLEGQATMHHSPAVRRFAEQHLAGGAIALYVDLRRCTHMDSTFLGTLLFLKRLAEQRQENTFALLSPSPQCRQLLQQMRLEKVFAILSMEEPAPSVWTELPSGPADPTVFKRNVVQAHQELGQLEGPAGATFRELATQLAQELDAEKSSPQQDKK
jgi:sigma-B regulation protein RsbU (phosphoserine phosphatase)